MARMFDEVAPVYDRLNTLMTGGLDGRWRRRAVRETGLQAGDSALDACCGTGRMCGLLADVVGPFGRVEGVDLSPAMIERAARRYRSQVQAHFQVGNAMELPFESGRFDAATIGFGLRNLPDFEAGFRELARVVRPGGRVVCLELSMPRHRIGHASTTPCSAAPRRWPHAWWAGPAAPTHTSRDPWTGSRMPKVSRAPCGRQAWQLYGSFRWQQASWASTPAWSPAGMSVARPENLPGELAPRVSERVCSRSRLVPFGAMPRSASAVNDDPAQLSHPR